MRRTIPFCDLTRAHEPLRADIDRAIAGCLDRSTFLRGPETAAFEEEWAAYCGQRHAVACNSGTDALSIAATALGLVRARIPATTLPLTAIGLHRSGGVELLSHEDARRPGRRRRRHDRRRRIGRDDAGSLRPRRQSP